MNISNSTVAIKLLCLAIIIVFTGSSAAAFPYPTLPPFYNETNAIPISLLEQLKDVQSTEEFFRRFVQPTFETGDRPSNNATKHRQGHASTSPLKTELQKNRDAITSPLLSTVRTTVNDESTDRLDSVIPPQTAASHDSFSGSMPSGVWEVSACIPRPQVVTVPLPPDHSLLYWPPCVTLERCGGCCGHTLYTCSPTESRVEAVKVLRVRYPPGGGGVFHLEGVEELFLEEHLSCGCGCSTSPAECSLDLHEFRGCQCVCRNMADSAHCHEKGKTWSQENCRCVCPEEIRGEIVRCQRGFYYSQVSCSCEKLLHSHFTNVTDIKDFHVVQLDKDGRGSSGTGGVVRVPLTQAERFGQNGPVVDYERGWHRERMGLTTKPRPTPRVLPVIPLPVANQKREVQATTGTLRRAKVGNIDDGQDNKEDSRVPLYDQLIKYNISTNKFQKSSNHIHDRG